MYAFSIKAAIQIGHPQFYKPAKWLHLWDYFNLIMLHEILFALIGHTGSIFIEQEKATIGLSNIDEMAEPQECESAPKFIVNPSLGFISQAEIEQLNNIILLGALFKQI